MLIDVENVVGRDLSRSSGTAKVDVPLRTATEAERAQLRLDVQASLASEQHSRVGRHRLQVWANGWAENLNEFERTRAADDLLPRYFGKYKEVRLGNDLFIDASGRAEVALLRQLQTSVVQYARTQASFSKLAEFGAGTGHNLLHLASDSTLSQLQGFEWSWSGIACMNAIGSFLEPRIGGRFFDYFEPGLSGEVDLRDTCAITVASLEQIGTDFRAFLRFLRQTKPAIVCNIEPIQELMGQHELGELSVEYSRRRNYLDGYYFYLRNLEQAGEVRILLEQESLVGSKFINGYGVMVWSWVG